MVSNGAENRTYSLASILWRNIAVFGTAFLAWVALTWAHIVFRESRAGLTTIKVAGFVVVVSVPFTLVLLNFKLTRSEMKAGIIGICLTAVFVALMLLLSIPVQLMLGGRL